MRARLLFTSLFAGVFAYAQATADTVRWTPDVVYKVVWNESPSMKEPLRFVARIRIERRREYIGQTRHSHYAAYARWLRSESFVADSLSERYLPLAQLYFDCFELESRRFQRVMNATNTDRGKELEDAELHAAGRIENIRRTTEDGADTAQVAAWRHWMDSALLYTPRDYIPGWTYGDIELGFDIGGGGSSFNGLLADYFGTAVGGWGYGFSVRYKRFALDYHELIANTRSDLPFSVADFKFTDSTRIQMRQGTAGFGYQVVRTNRWDVVPYAALSAFRIVNRDEPEGSLFEKSRASLGVEAGLLTEWRFYHPRQNNFMQFFWKVMLKVGYAPVDFLHKVDGGALRVQLGVGWTMRTVVNPRPE